MHLIKLEPYNPEWRAEFEAESHLIKTTLATDAITIHHVGSTAVEGLLSKPIIDIAIEADNFPPDPSVINQLESIGYQYRGEGGIKGRIWFTKGIPRKFNLHYCSIHSEIVRDQVMFRNALRKNVELRKEYENLKTANSAGKDIDNTEYALSKSSLIEKVLKGK